MSDASAGPMASVLYPGTDWKPRTLAHAGEAAGDIANPAILTWLDVVGTKDALETALADLTSRCDATGCESFEGIVAEKASRGGENPPRFPPKTKAFHRCVFSRLYHLRVAPHREDRADDSEHRYESLSAEEVHVLAGPSFAVTLRYPIRRWVVGLNGLDSPTERPLPEPHESLDAIRDRFEELGARRQMIQVAGPSGLDIAAAILDFVIDSFFDAIDDLREWTDHIDEQVARGDWLWVPQRKQPTPRVDQQLSAMRKLVRQARWTFLPADEISEIRLGPFAAVKDNELNVTFKDFEREAERALQTVHELADQVDQVVEHRNALKTDRLNDTTYALTFVATVLLIPTLIAAVYGMNFDNMPELHWRFGYLGVIVFMFTLGAGAWLTIRWWLHSRSGDPL